MINKIKSQSLEWNIKTHNKIALKYEKMHGEIYNNIEQNRLVNELKCAIDSIATNTRNKVAVDYGCGAGNLTRHLSNLNCEVIACDVSQGFLDLINSKNYSNNVTTLKINGNDLKEIADNSVDMVATYSVLHHIPDYLKILSEFMRILKTGGVIYIDHEPSTEFWFKNNVYIEFKNKINKVKPKDYKKYFIWTNYYDWIVRKFINPRYHREGDIHVFDDDHVEWKKVNDELCSLGGEIIISRSYLLFRRGYDISIYNEYKNKVTDMQFIICKK